MTICKTAIILATRTLVGGIHQFGSGYKFSNWVPSLGAWREVTRSNYHEAVSARSQAFIDLAYHCLDRVEDTPQYDGGQWTSYVIASPAPPSSSINSNHYY